MLMISLNVIRASLLASLILALAIFIDTGHACLAKQSKPQLNKSVKPIDVEQRTVPKPAQPESAQPPPDVVGKVPKDLRKAARKKETEKLVEPEKH
jgi:hypothetical protein